MRDVAIIGVGQTKFGEHWDRSLRELIVEAGLEALYDAHITSNDVDALYGGSMSSGRLIKQEHLASLIVDFVGLSGIPAVRIENACASGGVAFRQGYLAVASGAYDIVIIGGMEKMTDVSDELLTETLATSTDQEWEAFFGATLPALYAMMARRHMHDYGTTEEQMAMVAVKNHKHGALNAKAQFRREFTIEQVLNSPYVAEPLKMLECAPISDGASAVVLCPFDEAKKHTDAPVRIIGSGQASDYISLHSRPDICTMNAVKLAAERAYAQADKTAGDIDVAEVHDNFTITELIAIEDLGFVSKGEGGKATEEGRTALGGEIPVNPSGGLKALGHPLGATGVAQLVELVTQLRSQAEKRQVKGAEVGLALNIGGSGASAVVHILEVV